MSKVTNLYLYRLQKEVKKALEKKSPVVAYSQMEQKAEDLYFFYGEYLGSDQIEFLSKVRDDLLPRTIYNSTE